jgi:transcriptional regulator of acetoin/glycerol metabolism
MNPPPTLMEVERAAVVDALRYSLGNKTGAAWVLGIAYGTLYRKIRAFEIQPEEYMPERTRAAGESS